YEKGLKKESRSQILETRKFYEAVKQKVAQQHAERSNTNFDQRFPAFNERIETYVSSLVIQQIREQDKERFFPQPKDSLVLRVLKYQKRVLFSISQFPIKTGNLFRKIFRKSVQPPRVWVHQIPLKQLVIFYLKDELALKMQSLLYETNSFLS